MDAVKLMGETICKTAERSKSCEVNGCAKLVVFCNAPEDNPFMAGAFHGVTEADAIINVGVSGPGVVKNALEKVRGESFEVLCETIKKTAFKVTRVGQLVAKEASRKLGIPFGIVDLSLAPTPAVGDSVADILCEIGLEYAGAPGTTAALALLNDQVKKGGIMAARNVGGLSGAFIPVSEDAGMINAVNKNALTIEKQDKTKNNESLISLFTPTIRFYIIHHKFILKLKNIISLNLQKTFFNHHNLFYQLQHHLLHQIS